MLLFRWAVLLLLMGAAVCGAFYIGTGQERYRRWGLRTLRWVVVAGLAFFGVLILERLA
jgi:multisubunit Na+/H+ antiporter MnhB subunit